jgi:hypothetical protein
MITEVPTAFVRSIDQRMAGRYLLGKRVYFRYKLGLEEKIMRVSVILLLFIFVGCAADPRSLELVGKTEALRMSAPARKLSTFASYELKPMVLSPFVQNDAAKVKVAADLENAIRTKLQPLLDEWIAAPMDGRSGTLSIEPRLAYLRVVSSGARFFAGALPGESNIDMDLVLTEQATGQPIAKTRINRNASAFTGGVSVGKTDQNLLDYIVSITYHYLTTYY